MRHGKRTPMNGFYALRWLILSRDKFTCQYCGQHAPDVRLEVDHVVPVAQGGTDDPDNLKTSCWACNHGKEGLSVIAIRCRDRNVPIAQQPLVDERTSETVLNALRESTTPIRTRLIADKLNITVDLARVTLHRLKARGLAEHIGRYSWSAIPK